MHINNPTKEDVFKLLDGIEQRAEEKGFFPIWKKFAATEGSKLRLYLINRIEFFYGVPGDYFLDLWLNKEEDNPDF